jgi:hypothetical protein
MKFVSPAQSVLKASITDHLKTALVHALEKRQVRCITPFLLEKEVTADILSLELERLEVRLYFSPKRQSLSVLKLLALKALAYLFPHRKIVFVYEDPVISGVLTRISSGIGSIFIGPEHEPSTTRSVLLKTINKFRQAHGLRNLVESIELQRAAQAHCLDLANQSSYSHRGSDGRYPVNRAYLQGCRYRAVYETTVLGTVDPESMVKHWEESPSHRSILADPNLHEIGISEIRGNINLEPVLVAVYGGGRPRNWARRAYSHLIRVTGIHRFL